MSAEAPGAPGQLGVAVEPQRLMAYLGELGEWLGSRRVELDELDSAAQASAHGSELIADIRLGLTLWQSIKTRYDQMLTTWDSGRVGEVEREQLSQLIWSRLDTPGAKGTGMSVPDASRLSDALTAQLRQRLQIDPDGSQVTVRLKALRAQIERLRDQVGLEPSESRAAASATLGQLAGRVEQIADKASRGGDVGGMLGPLEAQASTFERDLIVGGAVRRQNASRRAAIEKQRAALAAREPALRDLAARAVAAVDPAPKYAVPAVANLGPVPVDTEDLNEYAQRLDQVAAAMDFVETAYARALADLDALLAEARVAEAAAARADADPGLAAMLGAARGVLGRMPVNLDAARPLMLGLQAYLIPKGGER